ncbi:MAG: methyltransferase domain-containing protein [Pseudomonadota bacterium]
MTDDKHTYLPAGFHQVDEVDDPDVYSSCLKLLDTLPHFATYKHNSYELLELASGDKVLDAGCGLGVDVLRMAQAVGPTGLVLGVDSSEHLLSLARAERENTSSSAHFLLCDLSGLPLADASFQKVRVDRVLQHVARPAAALSEMVRVLATKGRLYAYDNDWHTFNIVPQHREVTALLEAYWRDSFVNSDIGCVLEPMFLDAGLSEVKVQPLTYTLSEFAVADQVFNLSKTAHLACRDGLISEEGCQRWLDDLHHSDRRGEFRARLTAYAVIGTKR